MYEEVEVEITQLNPIHKKASMRAGVFFGASFISAAFSASIIFGAISLSPLVAFVAIVAAYVLIGLHLFDVAKRATANSKIKKNENIIELATKSVKAAAENLEIPVRIIPYLSPETQRALGFRRVEGGLMAQPA